MLMGVLQGDQGPARDIVCLNSGAALYAANVAGSIEEGLERAQKAIDSGAALACTRCTPALKAASSPKPL